MTTGFDKTYVHLHCTIQLNSTGAIEPHLCNQVGVSHDPTIRKPQDIYVISKNCLDWWNIRLHKTSIFYCHKEAKNLVSDFVVLSSQVWKVHNL